MPLFGKRSRLSLDLFGMERAEKHGLLKKKLETGIERRGERIDLSFSRPNLVAILEAWSYERQ